MPPKKQEQPKKSTKMSASEKTFGMKNKKGATAKKQIAQLETQVAAGKTPEQKRKDAEKAQKEAEKKATEQAQRDNAELFKPVQVQKVPFGVDPKTILCQYYKKGHCEKGRRCKFSHDLAVERKALKKNLYTDDRAGEDDEGDNKKYDTMDNWDEEKLRNVVKSKDGNPQTTTDKVCKYFIDAVENGKYGWFWHCPNSGDKCMYKHSLPAGFVLKTKEQRAAEKAMMDKSPLKTLTLEDFLEAARQNLTGALTPVTPETFAKWKKERMDKKAAEDEARKAKEATGRAMFEKGDWKTSDDEEGSDEESEEEDDEDDDDDDDAWDMEAMRRETEAADERREQERVAGGTALDDPHRNGINGSDQANG